MVWTWQCLHGKVTFLLACLVWLKEMQLVWVETKVEVILGVHVDLDTQYLYLPAWAVTIANPCDATCERITTQATPCNAHEAFKQIPLL